jgi:hypothetical protein
MDSKPNRRKALVVDTGDDGCRLWCREVDHPKFLFSADTGNDHDRAAMTFDVYVVGRK